MLPVLRATWMRREAGTPQAATGERLQALFFLGMT